MRALRLHRSAVLAACLLGASCAGPSASSRDVERLSAEVRALRDSNEKLEQRLQRLEDHQSVMSAKPVATKLADTNELPELTVVKLKPKIEPAPKIDTRISIVEPSPEALDALSTPAEAPVPNEDLSVVDAEYDSALEALRTGNLDGGVKRLQQFAQEHPKHARADNALYFAGVGQIGMSDLSSAAKTFEQLLAHYPAGDAVVDAMLKLAECRARMNQAPQARQLYSQVISHYPGTAAASQAEARLAALTP